MYQTVAIWPWSDYYIFMTNDFFSIYIRHILTEMLPKFTSEFRPKSYFNSVSGLFIIKTYFPYSLELMYSYKIL